MPLVFEEHITYVHSQLEEIRTSVYCLHAMPVPCSFLLLLLRQGTTRCHQCTIGSLSAQATRFVHVLLTSPVYSFVFLIASTTCMLQCWYSHYSACTHFFSSTSASLAKVLSRWPLIGASTLPSHPVMRASGPPICILVGAACKKIS